MFTHLSFASSEIIKTHIYKRQKNIDSNVRYGLFHFI